MRGYTMKNRINKILISLSLLAMVPVVAKLPVIIENKCDGLKEAVAVDANKIVDYAKKIFLPAEQPVVNLPVQTKDVSTAKNDKEKQMAPAVNTVSNNEKKPAAKPIIAQQPVVNPSTPAAAVPTINNNTGAKAVGWIPWIGGGVGSLFGGICQLGLNVGSWAANTVNDTTYTFTDGFFGKDTSLSKAAARGLIFWGTTAAIKYALRFEPMVQSVEKDFQEGLEDPVTYARPKGAAYWKDISKVNSDNKKALNTLEIIKKHYVFNVLNYSGLSTIIDGLIAHPSLQNEYEENRYIDALNARWSVYGINKGAWLFGAHEFKNKIISLYIRICLCERAVKNKQISEEILKNLKLSQHKDDFSNIEKDILKHEDILARLNARISKNSIVNK
jgi:hypothetical protein